jgi:hypothetical protein
MKKLTLILFVVVFTNCEFFFQEVDSAKFTVSITQPDPEVGNIKIDPDIINFSPGSEAVILATAEYGYYFVEWAGSVSGNQNPTVITIDKDLSVSAVFEKETYPVNIYVYGDGSVQETVIQQKADYEYGTVLQLTAVPNEGAEFIGWGGDIEGSDLVYTIEGVDEPIDVEATFTIVDNEPDWFDNVVWSTEFGPSDFRWEVFQDDYTIVNFSEVNYDGFTDWAMIYYFFRDGYYSSRTISWNNFNHANDYAYLIDFLIFEQYGGGQFIGFIFNQIDSNNFHMFVMQNDGYWAIWQQENGQWVDNAIDWKKSDFTFSKNTGNNWFDLLFAKIDDNYFIELCNDADCYEINNGPLEISPNRYGSGFGIANSGLYYAIDYIEHYRNSNQKINPNSVELIENLSIDSKISNVKNNR